MERIQKILAQGGIASRRAAEQLILAGRVRVNGKVITELGTKADPRHDRIEVDGKRVVAEELVYVVLHKPRGVVATMHDPEGRPTVKELLDSIPGRLYPVGRLDFATSGVLLATNDGELADGLMHPRKSVPKTYVLKVHGVMKPEDLERWRTGIKLEDGMTLPAAVKLLRHEGDKTWFELTIREGRNQQIRRMGEATGFPVMRLARLAFAEVSAEGLAPGRWRHLTRDELMELKKTYGVPRSIPAAPEQEAGARRIQTKAVHVRGAAVKGAAGRSNRNLGAEGAPARGRSRSRTEPREAGDEGKAENWGEAPARNTGGRRHTPADRSDSRTRGASPRGDARGPAADMRGRGPSARGDARGPAADTRGSTGDRGHRGPGAGERAPRAGGDSRERSTAEGRGEWGPNARGTAGRSGAGEAPTRGPAGRSGAGEAPTRGPAGRSGAPMRGGRGAGASGKPGGARGGDGARPAPRGKGRRDDR